MFMMELLTGDQLDKFHNTLVYGVVISDLNIEEGVVMLVGIIDADLIGRKKATNCLTGVKSHYVERQDMRKEDQGK